MNVLSVFDGMSCGQIALERAGIKVDNYFASEIKPHAIEVTQHNYPNTIQLGDITKITGSELPKIDLYIGGSPCQDFSRGNRERLGLKGDKSSLFYHYLRLKEETTPTKYLLENVVMEPAWYRAISESLGTDPVRICGSLITAAYRDRLYWTDIGPGEADLFGNRNCSIPLPESREVVLQDILTSGFADREKARCLLESDSRPLANKKRMLHRYKKFTTIVFEDLEEPESCRYLNRVELERCNGVPDGYTSMLTRNKAACLIGDGWNVDVVAYIFSFLANQSKGATK